MYIYIFIYITISRRRYVLLLAQSLQLCYSLAIKFVTASLSDIYAVTHPRTSVHF